MSPEETPRMLVVDDEVENTEFLRRLFRRDFSIEVATSGEEGLERLKEERFDVIITDQMMPGMSGTELLERSITLAPNAVRILVTGFPNLQSAMSSLNEGRAFRFFTKPLIRQELRDAVEEALARERASALQGKRTQALIDENAALLARLEALENRIEVEIQARAGGALDELERLRTMSPFDSETGLFTRPAIMERLEEEVSRCQRFGLVCAFAVVRIRNYHELCEAGDYGAGAMDRLAGLIRTSSRRYHSTGRWSEDSFALLMPHASPGNARRRVQRTLETANGAALESTGPDGIMPELGAGVAVFPIDGETADELADAADRDLAVSGLVSDTI